MESTHTHTHTDTTEFRRSTSEFRLKTPHASPKEKFLPDPGNDMGNVGVVVEQLLEGCQGQAGSRVLAATLNKPTPESLLKEP